MGSSPDTDIDPFFFDAVKVHNLLNPKWNSILISPVNIIPV